MNIAEYVVERLVDEGVEVVFTVPGEQHDRIFQALARTRIRVVQTRHEQAAAFMAYGYARSTGRIAAILVISGPGVLYALPGLATAFAGSSPVLCLATEIPTEFIGRGFGVPHEIPDQSGVLKSSSSWVGRITGPGTVDSVLDEAFHRLSSGRPRPVSIEMPVDVVSQEGPVPARSPVERRERPRLDAAAIEAARGELLAARNPIIYVGSGARAAAASIRQLAEGLGIPVTTEIGGRGILPAEHPLSVSFPCAHRVWTQVDVVLAIGTRFRRPQVEWGIEGLRVVRVDLDRAEMNRSGPPTVEVLGDANDVVRALLEGLEAHHDHAEWRATISTVRRAVEAELAAVTPQSGYLEAIRSALSSDGFFVDELTQVGYLAWAAFPVREPYTYISSTYLGALGFGFSTALGVKIAHPERSVVCITGDGGFLYTAVELATAVQHRIGVVVIVFDDGAYANVRRTQTNHMGFTIATELRNPDFVAFAESFGAVGVRVRDPDDLRANIEKGLLRRDVPTVIVVPVDDMTTPWPLVRLPKVR